MSTQQTALEHLRIIRSLMERAHVYRSISAPAALVGGLLSIALSAWGMLALKNGTPWSGEAFIGRWFAVLVITGVINSILLAREARSRGQQPFVSEGMRTAMRALAPPLLVGGIVGSGLILYLQNLTMGALIWVLCYGLALLATSGFSPRSLTRLGWMFIVTGLALFGAWAVNSDIRMLPSDEGPASLVMGLTFGLLHVIYAVAVFIRTRPAPEVAAE